jgi:hypothetical protein
MPIFQTFNNISIQWIFLLLQMMLVSFDGWMNVAEYHVILFDESHP